MDRDTDVEDLDVKTDADTDIRLQSLGSPRLGMLFLPRSPRWLVQKGGAPRTCGGAARTHHGQLFAF